MVAWWIVLAISIALQIAAYILMPKPKAPKPEAAQDLQSPTAEAGRPIPVPFGTLTVKGTNILWFGDKTIRTYKMKA